MSFKVGQKVTVRDNYFGPRKITTVARVGKLKMVLADGSEWKVSDHREWGNTQSFYTGAYVYAYQPGDDEKIERRRLIEGLQRIKVLRAVHAALRGVKHG